MPLLARFIGFLATGFVAVFSQILSYQIALKAAAYASWIVVLTLFLSTTIVTLTGLWSKVSSIFGSTCGGDWSSCSAVQFLGMGLGMFIPENATSCISAYGAIWIGTSIYKIQRDGIHTYGA